MLKMQNLDSNLEILTIFPAVSVCVQETQGFFCVTPCRGISKAGANPCAPAGW